MRGADSLQLQVQPFGRPSIRDFVGPIGSLAIVGLLCEHSIMVLVAAEQITDIQLDCTQK